jgi:DNA modification methylase
MGAGQKPTAMMADAIRDVTKRGAVVLDPFAGSGTTLIAAEKTGRLACAIECDPHYCDVIVRRWQAYILLPTFLSYSSASTRPNPRSSILR